jgi:hypothetical protein
MIIYEYNKTSSILIKILLLAIFPLISSNSYSFELNINKLRTSLKSPSNSLVVSYKNHLGEGSNTFDSLPRYNPNRVNCTTWWQQLLAESYTENRIDLIKVLDHIRYYQGIVSFGTRKHFLDHFLSEDPGPLEDINEQIGKHCNDDQIHSVELNLNLFKKSSNYSCPIAFEDKSDIVFTFLSRKKAIKCARRLDDGLYLAFPVATQRYISIWGKKSGPMGRVHGLIINKENNESTVFHASIDQGRVASEPFDKYVNASGSRLFRGYKIYRIKNIYSPKDNNILSSENLNNILSCEKKIK